MIQRTDGLGLTDVEDSIVQATISGFGFALGGLLFVYFLHLTKKGKKIL